MSSWFRNIQGQLSELASEVLSEATEETSDPESELQVLRRQRAEMEKSLVLANENTAEMTKKISELEEQIGLKDLEIESINSKYKIMVESRDNEIRSLKTEVERCTEFALCGEEEFFSLENTSILRMKQQIDEQNREIQHWKRLLDEECARRKEEDDSREEDNGENLSEKIDQFEKMISILKEENLSTLAELKTCKEKLAEATIESDKHRSLMEIQTALVEELKMKLALATDTAQEKRDLVLETHADIDDDEKEQLVDKLRKENNELAMAYNDLNEEFEAHKAEHGSIMVSNRELTNRIDALRANLIEYEERYELCKAENVETVSQLEKLSDDFKRLREAFENSKQKNVSNAAEEVERLRMELNASKVDRDALRTDVDKFRFAIESIDGELNKLRESNERLSRDNRAMGESLDKFGEIRNMLERSDSQLKSLRDKFLQLQREHTEKEEEWINQVRELTKARDEAKRELEEYRDRMLGNESLIASESQEFSGIQTNIELTSEQSKASSSEGTSSIGWEKVVDWDNVVTNVAAVDFTSSGSDEARDGSSVVVEKSFEVTQEAVLNTESDDKDEQILGLQKQLVQLEQSIMNINFESQCSQDEVIKLRHLLKQKEEQNSQNPEIDESISLQECQDSLNYGVRKFEPSQKEVIKPEKHLQENETKVVQEIEASAFRDLFNWDENKQFNERSKEIEQKNAEIIAENEKKEEKIRNVQKQLATCEDSLNEMIVELQDSQNEIVKLEKLLEESKKQTSTDDEMSNLQISLKQMEENLRSKNEVIKVIQQENDEMKRTIAANLEKDEKILNLEERLCVCERSFDNTLYELQNSQEKVAKLENLLEESKGQALQDIEKDETITNLEEQLATCKESHSNTIHDLEHSQRKIVELENILKQNEGQALQNDTLALTQMKEMEESLRVKDERIKVIELENDGLKESIASKEKSLGEIQEIRDQLIILVEQKHSESVNYHAQLELCIIDKEAKLAQIEHLESKIERLNEKFESNVEENEKLQNECERLRHHCLHIEETATRDAIRSEEREIDLRNKIRQLKLKVEETADDVTSSNNALQEKVVSLNVQLEAALSSENELREIVKQKDEMLEESKTGLTKLQNVLNEISSEQEVKVAVYESELSSLKDKIGNLNLDAEKSKDMAESLIDEKLVLEKTLITLRDELLRKETIIDELEMQLEERANSVASSNQSVTPFIFKHIFFSYLIAEESKRPEIAMLLTSMLEYNEEELAKIREANSVGDGKWSVKSKRSRSQSNQAISLTEQFIRFLENESVTSATSHPLPLEKTDDTTTMRSPQPVVAEAKSSTDELRSILDT